MNTKSVANVQLNYTALLYIIDIIIKFIQCEIIKVFPVYFLVCFEFGHHPFQRLKLFTMPWHVFSAPSDIALT